VGGASSFHPTSKLALALLRQPGSSELARLGAAVGLNQNFAAVLALVTDGIQKGHMALHARRLAWNAGARGQELEDVVRLVVEAGAFNQEAAIHALRQAREAGSAKEGGASPGDTGS
jgi:hydroxymethylglutaryl-CoA reductase